MTGTGSNPSGSGAGDNSRDQPDAAEAFARMAAPMATLLESYARAMGQIAAGASTTQTDGADAPSVGLPAAIVEAGLIASASAARYGQRMTDLLTRQQATLYAAAAGQLAQDAPSADRKRADADVFQAFIREVSEIALFEARRLEHELERLGEAVARDADAPPDDAPYRRYWGVTP